MCVFIALSPSWTVATHVVFDDISSLRFAMIDEPVSQTTNSELRDANRARFELELEFVQALANPYYLHTLAQQNVLDQPAFVNYLRYLLYWKEKDYARFIQYVTSFCPLSAHGELSTMCISYPHALHHLELLQHEHFRSEMKKDEWREFLNQKQFDHWRTW